MADWFAALHQNRAAWGWGEVTKRHFSLFQLRNNGIGSGPTLPVASLQTQAQTLSLSRLICEGFHKTNFTTLWLLQPVPSSVKMKQSMSPLSRGRSSYWSFSRIAQSKNFQRDY